MKTYQELRDIWPVFIYKSFDMFFENKTVRIVWHFEIPGLADFHPEINIPTEHLELLNDPLSRTAHELAFSMGMVELVSYWKTTCSPHVVIECGGLNAGQIAWWKDLYFGGLGEFFYQNKIAADFETFMTIQVTTLRSDHDARRADAEWRSAELNLIPVGGGKDSVVTLERLSTLKDNNLTFAINPTRAARDCMRIAGYKDSEQLCPRRTLDPMMLELNRRGYLNGHTPFSAVVAFTAYYCAYLVGAEYIVLSNEASANESSVPGTDVNHQFSKTSEFEEAFQNYARNYLGVPIFYFSLLRPFNELCIARDFASHSQYFNVFRSCNVGSKQNIWCGECAKCLFIAIMIAPFVGFDTATKIFGKDMFADERLADVLDQLDGAVEVKAFECVGTVGEVRYALNLLIGRWRDLNGPGIGQQRSKGAAGADLPVLLKRYLGQCVDGTIGGVCLDSEGFPYNDPLWPDPLTTFHTRNRVPAEFLPLLEDMNRLSVADYLRDKKILILGYGREGHSSLEWITKHLRSVRPVAVAVADKNEIHIPEALVRSLPCGPELLTGETYMDSLGEYDIVLKSPGISFAAHTEKWLRPGVLAAFPNTEITGQVDLFLRFGPTRKVIGVTGTKGKSTTTSLIYEMLRCAGFKAELLGNIGTPIFERMDALTADSRVALELSSHQLQFVTRAPHVAVITNFYHEHLDHYRSYEEYVDSKLNIVRGQKEDDMFVLNADQPEIVEKALPLAGGRIVSVGRKRMDDSAASDSFVDHGDTPLPEYRYDVVACERNGRLLFHNANKALRGLHNACDAALAAAAALAAGVDENAVAQGVRRYPGIPHRMEPIGTVRGIEFYNDSIATIPESAILAIETLETVETLIVGGMDRGLDYSDFADFIRSSSVRVLICLPDTGTILARLCAAHDPHPEIYEVGEMEAAVELAFRHTRPGAICLLSPAASSYNHYENFAERGNAFKRAVLGGEDNPISN
ncbi:MAG: UDP-N-acetylmuramoyl-L-alanine--D-glutamate ligase [Fastidiosipilaceae bacterium]|jgi:UDP-N-acetylmuramoylalanine--D-glutamate ligase